MHIGHYISGAAHISLIAWALFGGMFKPHKQEIEFTQVAVISSAEFEAMQAQFTPPQPLDQMPDQPQPSSTEAPPEPVSAPEEPVALQPKPDPVPVPQEPQVPTPPEPMDIPTPDVTSDTVVMPTPEPTVETSLPTVADSKPIDANRVAPIPVAPETPAAEIDDIVREQAVAAPEPSQIAKPQEKATAPEAATSAIITEAVETGKGAPSASLRPKSRPARPDPVTDPVQEPEKEPAPAKVADTKPDAKPETPSVTEDAVQAALAAAMASSAPAAPVVASLSASDMNGLRLSVQQCWVVDVGSEAANIAVTIAMSLDRDGRVDANTIALIDATDGSQTAIDIAFQSARRAILRCQKDGYELPVDKYDQWRDIEMTFNPESMRTR